MISSTLLSWSSITSSWYRCDLLVWHVGWHGVFWWLTVYWYPWVQYAMVKLKIEKQEIGVLRKKMIDAGKYANFVLNLALVNQTTLLWTERILLTKYLWREARQQFCAYLKFWLLISWNMIENQRVQDKFQGWGTWIFRTFLKIYWIVSYLSFDSWISIFIPQDIVSGD